MKKHAGHGTLAGTMTAGAAVAENTKSAALRDRARIRQTAAWRGPEEERVENGDVLGNYLVDRM